MRYHLKKAIFFCLSILAICGLGYLFLLELYHVCAAHFLEEVLGIGDFFSTDAMIGPCLLAITVTVLQALVSVLFYRRELRTWPVFLLLLSAVAGCFWGLVNDRYISARMSEMELEAGLWLAVYCAAAAVTLAALIWLIAAMVKYPKTPQ